MRSCPSLHCSSAFRKKIGCDSEALITEEALRHAGLDGGTLPVIEVRVRGRAKTVRARVLHDGAADAAALLAREAGLKELIAEVLPENAAMLKLFNKFGFRRGSKGSPQVVHLTMQLA